MFNNEDHSSANVETYLYSPQNIASSTSGLVPDTQGNIPKTSWADTDDAIKKESIF